MTCVRRGGRNRIAMTSQVIPNHAVVLREFSRLPLPHPPVETETVDEHESLARTDCLVDQPSQSPSSGRLCSPTRSLYEGEDDCRNGIEGWQVPAHQRATWLISARSLPSRSSKNAIHSSSPDSCLWIM